MYIFVYILARHKWSQQLSLNPSVHTLKIIVKFIFSIYCSRYICYIPCIQSWSICYVDKLTSDVFCFFDSLELVVLSAAHFDGVFDPWNWVFIFQTWRLLSIDFQQYYLVIEIDQIGVTGIQNIPMVLLTSSSPKKILAIKYMASCLSFIVFMNLFSIASIPACTYLIRKFMSNSIIL